MSWLTPERTIDLIGLVLIPLFLWWIGRREKRRKAEAEERRKESIETEKRTHEAINAAAKKAYDEGVQATLAEQQRAATKAEHERLDGLYAELQRQNQRYSIDREFMLRKGVIPAGSQVGEDGRGVRNPLLDPEEEK